MSFSLSRRCMALVISLALAHAPVMAQQSDTRYEINLPQQSLADSLRALGKTAHVNIVFEPAAVQGKRAQALSGRYTPKEALERLLSGLGLTVASTAGGSYSVAVAAASSQTTTTPATPGSGQSAAGAVKLDEEASKELGTAFGGVVQMADVLVVGQRLNTYVANSSDGATRTDTDLLETPQSVSVITRKLFDDQQMRTLSDVLRNASGVDISNSIDGASFTVRGFSNASVSVDGMGDSSSTRVLMPIVAADSVEVLKGPEGILAGTRVEPGGSINVTLKQPQVTPIATWTMGVGSYGLTETALDLGGALNAGKTWSYRLIAQVERADRTANGYNGVHGFYLAPSLRWASGGTDVVVGFERSAKFSPTILFVTSPIGLERLGDSQPVGRYGEKDDGYYFPRTRSYYKLEQDLGDSGWTYRSRGEYTDSTSDAKLWQLGGRPTAEGDTWLGPTRSISSSWSRSFHNELMGAFSTGPFQHRVLLGAYYLKWTGKSLTILKDFIPYNIYARQTVPSWLDVPTRYEYGTGPTNVGEVGYVAQDQISYGEKWHALLAMRRGLYHGYGVQLETRRWLPNFGLVYKVSPDASLYANRMVSYKQAIDRRTPEGNMLPGMLSEQYEIGYKRDMMQRRLSWTVAAYQIAVDNSATWIPGTEFFIPGPGQTSRGIETELRGKLTEGLDVSVTMSHVTVKRQPGSDGGAPIVSQPRNTGSLWAAYRFQSEPLQKWSIAAGIFARSKTTVERRFVNWGDPTTYMENPGNARVDAHIGYTEKNWALNLGIRNLLDRRLYSTSANDYYGVLDDLGRTYMLTAQVNL